MEMQTNNNPSPVRTSVKDFFINLGAVIALYVLTVSLLNLLFNIINNVYPQIRNGYSYYASQSISWPVSILVILFPVFILLMWLLGKEHELAPEKKNSGIHKWLTYITLFISGAVLIGDLVTVLYYFIDGQELTSGFLLKVLSVFVIMAGIFVYYISDIRGKLTPRNRVVWRAIAIVLVLGSILLGFSVLGSPRTQRLYKYDEQKINDLQNINSEIKNYYRTKGALPDNLDDIATRYYTVINDPQTGEPYGYEKIGNINYNLCAKFNKASKETDRSARAPLIGGYPVSNFWLHPAGEHCFEDSVSELKTIPGFGF